MSIDIQWEKLTKGDQGAALAEKVRAFIHDRFQQIQLPQFIHSVNVHAFNFGDTAPEIEIKDICDPHPDFYSSLEDSDDDDQPIDNLTSSSSTLPAKTTKPNKTKLTNNDINGLDLKDHDLSQQRQRPPMSILPLGHAVHRLPVGTSHLNYFNLPFSPSISGTATPLAAVAGAQFPWPDHYHFRSSANHSNPSSSAPPRPPNSDPSSPSSAAAHSPPPHDVSTTHSASHEPVDDLHEDKPSLGAADNGNSVQIVSHVKYSGNLGLVLSAEVLLDYPMSNFVGIPFKLSITGFAFDGVSILAYAQNKLHFCFLSPDDAAAFSEDQPRRDNLPAHPPQLPSDNTSVPSASLSKIYTGGGLLEHIRIESEIGQREVGKQVLRNVGKVEKFVLEQVRQIFESEFVFPNYWTFLV